jgi:hypothetical protein
MHVLSVTCQKIACQQQPPFLMIKRNTLCMCMYTMCIHSVYLVSDLEGSDNGDPLNGIIIVVTVSHGLVTVLETLKNVLRTQNEVRRGFLYSCERTCLSL